MVRKRAEYVAPQRQLHLRLGVNYCYVGIGLGGDVERYRVSGGV
jgi:hypothetical protein